MVAQTLMRPRKTERGGFTLVELLVVVAMIAMLAALLLPALSTAREKGKSAVCQSNLKQLGIAFAMYWNDYNDYLPPAVDLPGLWVECIIKYLGGYGRNPGDVYLYHPTRQARVLKCPSTTLVPSIAHQLQYGYNCLSLGTYDTNNPAYPRYPRVMQVTRPAERLMVGETPDHSFHDATGYFCAANNGIFGRHKGYSNVLFVDTHVAPMWVEPLLHEGPASWFHEPFNYFNQP